MATAQTLVRHSSQLQSSIAARIPSRIVYAANLVALVGLAIIYSGAERYFWRISKVLHYGFDAVLVASIVVLFVVPKRDRSWLGPAPYLAWVVVYYAWGTVVSPAPAAVAATALSAAILNALILGLIALSLASRGDVGKLAIFMQVALLANLAVALVQDSNGQLIARMAYFLNPTSLSYNIVRPAGLWVNPNVAGIGYLFGFLLSFWAAGPRPLIWLARGGAVAGIYLTGSRGAMYPLLFCTGVLILGFAWRKRPSRSQVAVFLAGVAVVAVVVAAILRLSPSNSPTWYELRRFQDISLRGPSDPSRLQSLEYWLPRAIHGPWYGTGVFSFQGDGRALQGAHDIFVTVWGETGVVMLIIYLAVLGLGLALAARPDIPPSDRLVLLVLWAAYLIEGFAWHNQFTDVVGIVIIGLLYRLPFTLQVRRRIEQWKPFAPAREPGPERSVGLQQA